jgi:hypothetical protein
VAGKMGAAGLSDWMTASYLHAHTHTESVTGEVTEWYHTASYASSLHEGPPGERSVSWS